MKLRSLSLWKPQLGFGFAILALLLVGAVSYRARTLSVESDRWVRHTHEVLESLQDWLGDMKTVESSTRGFVITGDGSYLHSYQAALEMAWRDEAAFRQLTIDNPAQQERLATLDGSFGQEVELAEVSIGLRQADGLGAAAEDVRAGSGQRAMDAFEATIRAARAEELRLLALRSSDADRESRRMNTFLILGTVLGALIAAFAGWSVHRDNARRRRAEDAMQQSEAALFAERDRAQVTLNSIGDAVACTDALGNISFINAVAEHLTGWPSQDAVGRAMADVLRIIDTTTRETIPNPMAAAAAQNRAITLPDNCLLIRRDGAETPIEDSVAPIHDREGRVIGAVIVFRDVSVARALALQTTHRATHDFLTDLPNRMLLNDRIGQAIGLARRHMKKVAVLFLDLDGFKDVNDLLGHATGDRLLQSVTARLVGCMRASDTVSRLGGDEFVALLSDMERPEDAALCATRMLQAVAELHAIDERELHVTASIGISIYPDAGLDAETLLKHADAAMYQAKKQGRQQFAFFEPAMDAEFVASPPEPTTAQGRRPVNPVADPIKAMPLEPVP